MLLGSAVLLKAGNPGSWNRYSYARLDPANRNDPKGLDDDDDDDDIYGGSGNGPEYPAATV